MTCIKDSVCMPIFGWTRDQGNGLKENDFLCNPWLYESNFHLNIDLHGLIRLICNSGMYFVIDYLYVSTLKSHSLATCLQTCGLFRYVCAWPFHTLFSTFLFLYHLPFTQFSGYLDPNPIQLFAKYIVCVVSV